MALRITLVNFSHHIVNDAGETIEKHAEKAIAETRLAFLTGSARAPVAAAAAPKTAPEASGAADVDPIEAMLKGRAGDISKAIARGAHDERLGLIESSEQAGAQRRGVLKAIEARRLVVSG